jgi:hypothetical protein
MRTNICLKIRGEIGHAEAYVKMADIAKDAIDALAATDPSHGLRVAGDRRRKQREVGMEINELEHVQKQGERTRPDVNDGNTEKYK